MNEVSLLDVIRIAIATRIAGAVLWLIPGKSIYSHGVGRINSGLDELAKAIDNDD